MLKPQQVHIPFVSGLNQSVDEKIAPEGTLASAKNIRFDRAGRIIKRGSYRYFPKDPLTEGQGVMASADTLFISNGAMTHRNPCNPNQPSTEWYPVEFDPSMHAERSFIPTDAATGVWDGAEWWDGDWGFGVFVWHGSESTLSYVVYDGQTRAKIHGGDISTSITGLRGVRVLADGNGIHVVYMDDTGSGGVAYATWIESNSAHLGLIPTATALPNTSGDLAFQTAGNVHTEEIWDACATSGGFAIAYYVEGATRVRLIRYTYTTVYAEAAFSSHSTTYDVLQLALARGSGSQFWLCRRQNIVNRLEVAAVSAAALTTGGYTYISSSTGANIVHSLGGAELANDKTVWTWEEAEISVSPAATMYRMYWAECDTSGGGSAVGPWSIPNARPNSRPFCSNGMGHVMVIRRNSFFSGGSGKVSYATSIGSRLASAFLMSFPTSETENYPSGTTNRNYVSALLTTGLTPHAQTRVPNATPSYRGFVFHGYDLSLGYAQYDPEQKLGARLGADAQSFEGNFTVWECSAGAYSHRTFCGLLARSDGTVAVYDDQGSREVCLPSPPQILAMLPSSTGGWMTSSASYQFVAVWEWYTGGVRYQSEPSVPETIDLGASDNNVTVTIAQLATGVLGDTRQHENKKLVLYRTVANGGGSGIFYRLRNTVTNEGVADADQTADYAELFVSDADADIVGNEVLYTASSLPNQAVPGGPATAVHKSRLWVGGGLDPYRVYYSQPSSFGLPPRFSLAMYIDIPADTRVTAMASAGDVLAVFTENAVYAVLGDGPNTLGEPVDGFRVQLVSSGTGSVSQKGVVETPDGVFFVSPAGLRLLTAGLQVVPIGEQVQDLFSADSGVLVGSAFCRNDETTCFTFAADSAYVVVFDHLRKVWTVDYPSVVEGYYVGCAAFRGALAILDTDGIPYLYDTTQLSDSKPSATSAQYLMDFETAWLKMGEFTGFKRLMWVHLLGERDGSCPVNVEVTTGYTDGSTNKTTHSWTAADIAALDHFELRAHLKYQRGSAFKVRVAEQAGVSPNAGFQANALGLIYGVRGTLTKMGTEASK